MTTAAQRLVALSGLASGTAAQHLIARSGAPGTASQRLLAASALAVGTAAAHLISAVQQLPLPSAPIAAKTASTVIQAKAEGGAEIEAQAQDVVLKAAYDAPKVDTAAAVGAGTTLDASPTLAAASSAAAVPSLGLDVKTITSLATPRAIELTSETASPKPQVSAGLAAGFSYTQTAISLASERTLPPIGFEDLLVVSDSLTVTRGQADGVSVSEQARVVLGKNLTDVVFAGDQAVVVLDSATTGLTKNVEDPVVVSMTGRLILQGYTSPTYFADDYVGSVRTLT